jgi:3-keto steroid reductase
MGLPPWSTSSSQVFALVTGANRYVASPSLHSRVSCSHGIPFNVPLVTYQCPSQLTPAKRPRILKSRLTISRLRAHLTQLCETESARVAKSTNTAPNPQAIFDRVHFLAVELDLCNLRQVKDAARQLREGEIGGTDVVESSGRKIGKRPSWKIDRLDVLVLNAGIGGWSGLNWPLAIWTVLTDLVQAVTWPAYKVADVGKRTKLQSSYGKQDVVDGHGGEGVEDEPVLGEVFTANVFGHYVFAHEVMPLLSKRDEGADDRLGRIIWISSIEALSDSFKEDDLQGMESDIPYESSKRLTDILAITSELPGVTKASQSFYELDVINKEERENLGDIQKPKMYVAHPGICATEIVPLNFILAGCMTLCFYLARWLGSPWHTVSSYTGACAPVWLSLAPQEQLDAMESGDRDGQRKGKWGSSTDIWGESRVRRTEVGGWGWDGRVEAVGKEQRRGRKRGARDLTPDERVEFEVLGSKCWRDMEDLRRLWDKRL